MSQLLRRVEYRHLAEDWALALVTSVRSSNLTASRPVSRDRLADTWSIYLDAGGRLIWGIEQLSVVGDTALAIVEAEIAAR